MSGERRRRIYAERGRVAKIRDKKHLSNDFDIIVNPKRDLPSSRSTILLIFVILVEIKRKGNSSLEIFYSVVGAKINHISHRGMRWR